MARRGLALVFAGSFAVTAAATVNEKDAAPDLEKAVGELSRCYEPFASGPSSLPGELVLAGTASARASSLAGERSPFVMSVDFEGRGSEVVFDDERVRLVEARAVARLDAEVFVVAGVTPEDNVIALVERTGKVEQVRKLAADVSLVGIERGSANDFLVYGRFGSRPYYAGLKRSLSPVFERFPIIASSYGQVFKARYSRARDAIWMLVQGADGPQSDGTVSLVKHDLLGNTLASTSVKSMYADFEETADGVVLLHYTAADETQNLIVSSFDRALKPRWVSEPIRARRGLVGPKLAVLKDKVLVVAANEFKLSIAAFDLAGRPLWTYRDKSSSLSPGSTYFVAHDATRLLVAQPDRRGAEAGRPAPDPSCTRIRVVRF